MTLTRLQKYRAAAQRGARSRKRLAQLLPARRVRRKRKAPETSAVPAASVT